VVDVGDDSDVANVFHAGSKRRADYAGGGARCQWRWIGLEVDRAASPSCRLYEPEARRDIPG
jgi:hypothetical protein